MKAAEEQDARAQGIWEHFPQISLILPLPSCFDLCHFHHCCQHCNHCQLDECCITVHSLTGPYLAPNDSTYFKVCFKWLQVPRKSRGCKFCVAPMAHFPLASLSAAGSTEASVIMKKARIFGRRPQGQISSTNFSFVAISVIS